MKKPLADKIRPLSIDDVVGQKHILGKDKPLRRLIESNNICNLIFYGPSGVGKTTVANIIAKNTNMLFHKLNGTTASTADIKNIVSSVNGFSSSNGILLYIDEIQYLNRKQQQVLLEFIEDGTITLIASTTENPYFYIYNAILSRSTVFEFKPVPTEEIKKAVIRAFDLTINENYHIEENVYNIISSSCGGDVRKALNTVELCILSADLNENGQLFISDKTAEELIDKNSFKFDNSGDYEYDTMSAFQKSLRGSDTDAALFYLAKFLVAGDLITACRRLMVCACEDVGLAYPQAIPIVKACVDIALQVGLPEARIPLADAVILIANSPKSNSGEMAIDKAMADVQKGKGSIFPRNLQNKHFDGEDAIVKGQNYLYPHDYENHWVKQQYMPDDLINTTYYQYGNNKNEQAFKEYWDKIKNTKNFKD